MRDADGRNELPSSSPRAAEIRKSLDQTVIPEIDIENVKAEDALKVWHNASNANHRGHFEFRVHDLASDDFFVATDRAGETA